MFGNGKLFKQVPMCTFANAFFHSKYPFMDGSQQWETKYVLNRGGSMKINCLHSASSFL